MMRSDRNKDQKGLHTRGRRRNDSFFMLHGIWAASVLNNYWNSILQKTFEQGSWTTSLQITL